MPEPTPTAAPQPAATNADYPRPDLEPVSEEEIAERKNPLGYSVTEPTEEEIEGEDDGTDDTGEDTKD